MAKFYITSAIPYVNAKPHIGWALEIVQADVIARYHKLRGDETRYLCGSDENSLKNVQAAEKVNLPIQQFVDEYSAFFVDLAKQLNVHFDIFQRGSNPEHHTSAQKLWELCAKNGDIYKKAYTGLYCVGCEMFYTKDELNENGECFEHPGRKLEEVTEENYFFKLSAYKEQLIKLIDSGALAIEPEFRKNEVLSFLNGELQDISISRSNERAKNWGVSVPDDDSQKMYVWFDALNIYQSGVGFGLDEELYNKWWPADVHAIGKGIIRFHAVYWPAFLLSAKLNLPKKLFVHEYITVNGQKMSKTLGNVINPIELIEKYGADALRYYLLAHISPFLDGDFSEEKFKIAYNADLANGLGNLVARVAKLCENNDLAPQYDIASADGLAKKIESLVETYKFNEALALVWGAIRGLDQYLNKERPWQQDLDAANKTLTNIILGTTGLTSLIEIAYALKPFLPETSEKILEQFKGPKITSAKPLFPRL